MRYHGDDTSIITSSLNSSPTSFSLSFLSGLLGRCLTQTTERFPWHLYDKKWGKQLRHLNIFNRAAIRATLQFNQSDRSLYRLQPSVIYEYCVDVLYACAALSGEWGSGRMLSGWASVWRSSMQLWQHRSQSLDLRVSSPSASLAYTSSSSSPPSRWRYFSCENTAELTTWCIETDGCRWTSRGP